MPKRVASIKDLETIRIETAQALHHLEERVGGRIDNLRMVTNDHRQRIEGQKHQMELFKRTLDALDDGDLAAIYKRLAGLEERIDTIDHPILEEIGNRLLAIEERMGLLSEKAEIELGCDVAEQRLIEEFASYCNQGSIPIIPNPRYYVDRFMKRRRES